MILLLIYYSFIIYISIFYFILLYHYYCYYYSYFIFSLFEGSSLVAIEVLERPLTAITTLRAARAGHEACGSCRVAHCFTSQWHLVHLIHLIHAFYYLLYTNCNE